MLTRYLVLDHADEVGTPLRQEYADGMSRLGLTHSDRHRSNPATSWQDKPSGWTFDKAQAEEAEEEYAEAMDKRRIILRKRAVIEDVKVRVRHFQWASVNLKLCVCGG